jgi:hypothetical protein
LTSIDGSVIVSPLHHGELEGNQRDAVLPAILFVSQATVHGGRKEAARSLNTGGQARKKRRQDHHSDRVDMLLRETPIERKPRKHTSSKPSSSTSDIGAHSTLSE